MCRGALMVSFGLLLPASGAGQPPPPIPVHVQHYGDDWIGTRLTARVEEEFLASRQIHVVRDLQRATLVVHLATIHSGCADLSTAAVTLFQRVDGKLIGTSIQNVSATQIDQAARLIVNETRARLTDKQ